VQQHDLPAIYSMAKVFFFPSIYEEFGIPNCEAMACGTPIVTANRAGPPEIAGDAALLVDPLDVDAMAAALVRLLDDAALREELSQRGLARSRRYSWTETARVTLEVLRSVGRSTVAAPSRVA
jgi:glycosyltransferase involved in cell wall biosynthesis